MRIKKCPYCGKRISYISSYASRRKSEFICERCGKESKVVIDKKVILFFIIMLVISLAIMAVWIFTGLISNPIGIAMVAAPLILYAFFTPKFVNFEPLKKYKKSMEAKKEGIAYSDNLLTSELESNNNFSFQNVNQSADNGEFQINTDIFNKIKAERNAEREKLSGDDVISDSKKIKDDYISIIDDVSEKHSSTEVPLKKIHSENSYGVSRRNHHFYPDVSENNKNTSENYKKAEKNRFSSNRKF